MYFQGFHLRSSSFSPGRLLRFLRVLSPFFVSIPLDSCVQSFAMPTLSCSSHFFSIIIIIIISRLAAAAAAAFFTSSSNRSFGFSCGLLHDVRYPFGLSGSSCLNYDLVLNCSEGAARWSPYWPEQNWMYEVVNITKNEGPNVSFVIRSDAMSNCSHVHPATDLASQQISFDPYSNSRFSISPHTSILIFNCTSQPVSLEVVFVFGFNYSTRACKALYTACLQNHSLSTTCFETSTPESNFEYLSKTFGCSSYTSFYNVPSDLPSLWPAQSDTGIQVQLFDSNWVYYEDCMHQNRTFSDDECIRCISELEPNYFSNGKLNRRKFAIIGVPILTGTFISLIWIVCWLRKLKRDSPFLILIATLIAWISTIYQLRKSYRKSWNTDSLAEKPLKYSYAEMFIATKSFSTKIGEGGFGTVYKGVLTNGNLVAVKVLSGSRQSEKQFANEVASIGSIHHVNLVRLVGFCSKASKRILVYEYVVNGSLDKQLFEANTVLGWKQRHSIAVGIARGLAYLHQDCRKRIIHCDIKPGNILLDDSFSPKIADFGLAKLMNRDESQVLTTVRGTPGYVAPEFWSRRDGPVTEKSDVYSFGMLLFELIGGRRNMDLKASVSQLYFPEWAFKEVVGGRRKEGEVLEEALVDKRIMGREVKMEEVRVVSLVALWCIQAEASRRPRMSEVVEYLEGSAEVPGDPPFPFDASENVLVGGDQHGEELCVNLEAAAKQSF